MLNKELKKLSRKELVDIIYQLKKNEQEKQEEIEKLQKELENKRIRISDAGSVADAALSITDLFSNAQATADLYLDEIAMKKKEAEKECAEKISKAEKEAQTILENAKKQLDQLKETYVNAYSKWQELQAKVDALEEELSNKNKE